jgi:hypothetical protein
MAEQPDREQPSLELPSLFKRKPKRVAHPTPVGLAGTSPARLPPVLAAVISGAATGLLGVGLTWLGLRGCSAIRDTSSCGDPGFLLLLAIVVAMALAGRLLLRAWRVPDAGSVSVLATALMAVLTMLFLMGSLEDTWTVVVLPVLGALTFALAHWVTSSNTEPGDRTR